MLPIEAVIIQVQSMFGYLGDAKMREVVFNHSEQFRLYWSFCRTFQLPRQSGNHFGFAAAMRQMGDHNPFDFTIPLTTMIFIAFDHSKILNIKNLFPLTTGLCSSQRE